MKTPSTIEPAHSIGRPRRPGRLACNRRTCGLLTVIWVLVSAPSLASWPGNPSTNVPISTRAGDDADPAVAPDAQGGVFVAWTNGGRIYVQHIDTAGSPLWAADGIVLNTPATPPFVNVGKDVQVAVDDSGGVIVAWHDYDHVTTTGVTLNVQRLNSTGAPSGPPEASR